MGKCREELGAGGFTWDLNLYRVANTIRIEISYKLLAFRPQQMRSGCYWTDFESSNAMSLITVSSSGSQSLLLQYVTSLDLLHKWPGSPSQSPSLDLSPSEFPSSNSVVDSYGGYRSILALRCKHGGHEEPHPNCFCFVPMYLIFNERLHPAVSRMFSGRSNYKKWGGIYELHIDPYC